MIRENRRPLLAFALVATVCAATLVQGVRSEALQGFVGAQVPQMRVDGVQLVPVGAADATPTAMLHAELPAATAPGVPAPPAAERPRISSAPLQGDTEARPDHQTEEGAGPAHAHARPPAHSRPSAHAEGHGRPEHAGRQRSHRGRASPRAALPSGRHREAGRADWRRTDRARPSDASQGRPRGRGTSEAEGTG